MDSPSDSSRPPESEEGYLLRRIQDAQPPEQPTLVDTPPSHPPVTERSRELKLYAVPRTFDLASMLVVSLAYSLFFTGLSLLSAPWGAYAFFGGLSGVVAISQGFFPYGDDPRWASAIAGGCYCLIASVVIVTLEGHRDAECLSCSSVILGPFLGYVMGACEAGVFLLADKLRKRLEREAEDDPQEPQSPFD